MSVLSAQSIMRVKPLSPIEPRTQDPNSGCSYGLSACGYDIRLDQDVMLGPGKFILASTMEEFHMPTNVVGVVHDKSTWVRRGLQVFNTCIEPGWRGFLTLELKNVHPESKWPWWRAAEEPIIEMKRGTPVAQVIFSWLDAHTEFPYAGKYMDQPRGPVAARDGTGYK